MENRIYEESVLKRLVEIAEDSVRSGFSLFLGNSSSTIILAARLLGPSGYGTYSLTSLVAPMLLLAWIELKEVPS